jgi:DUF1680 family protein
MEAVSRWEVIDVNLQGYVGSRIDGCLEHRVKAQDTDELLATYFNPRNVNGQWASEFWGKWVQGAIAYYHYSKDPVLYAKIKDSAEKMMSAQQPDGYLGDHDKATRAGQYTWDVWGRKYTLLGLIKYYRLSGDKRALKAACLLLDYTMTEIGPDRKHIWQTGLYRGMPPASILEPVMLLYADTKEERYLKFAQFIVDDCEGEGGPRLVAKCDEPVGKRFPLQPGQAWWSFENGQKGYEMMSCYVGLLELYRATGNTEYLEAARTAYEHVRTEEINVAGGACTQECFYGGHALQTYPAQHTMETCVTFTWMQYSERLLDITGDSRYVDELERTMYNALMASMKADNSQIVQYTPLEGFRREGVHQCGVHINCCNANAPRAFAMIPRVAYRVPAEGRVDVNLYIPSTAKLKCGKRTLTLTQNTEYPRLDVVEMTVMPDKPFDATLALRIPGWSARTEVTVNGTPVENVTTGEYCEITRSWTAGDVVRLHFDMPAQLVRLNHMGAIRRGPIVLARDSRFNDGDVDVVLTIPEKNGVVELLPVENAPAEMWMACGLRVTCGTYADRPVDQQIIHLCDFASACNTWDETVRYRTWLPLLYQVGRAD